MRDREKRRASWRKTAHQKWLRLLADPEAMREYQQRRKVWGKRYRERHKEKLSQAATKQYRKNKAKIDARQKAWNEQNKDKRAEYQRRASQKKYARRLWIEMQKLGRLIAA